MFSLPPKKILLVEPPFYRFFNYERWYYPVTLTLVGTYLEKMGHYVQVYDADAPSPNCRSLSRTGVLDSYHLYENALENENHSIWCEVTETIATFKPDIVGITSITPKIDSANIVARITKKLYGDKVKVILGGPHAYAMRAMYPDYDFGRYYDDIVTHIPNLVDQKPNKKLIMNVEQYSAQHMSSLLTTAGCPFTCTFCCRSFDRRFVHRKIASVRKELEELKDEYRGTLPVMVMDDCLLTNSRRFYELAETFREVGLTFTSGSRVMSITPQKLETFMNSGGVRILLGVESGSQRILDRIKKKLNVEETIKRTKWVNEAGLPWQAFVVVGFPFETLDDLKRTEELLYTIRPTLISVNRFTPYPGTEIYKEYFLNAPFKFRDLFQINRKNNVGLTDVMENYIEHLFTVFDDYNKTKKAREDKTFMSNT